MDDLNKIILIGRLGQEAEIKTLPSGNSVCNLSIVTESSWKDKNGERQTKSEWHKVVTFDQNMINYCQSFVGVGDSLYIEGRLTYRTVEIADGTTGKKIKLPEIHVTKYGGNIAIYRKKRSEGAEGTEKSHGGKYSDDDHEFIDVLDSETSKTTNRKSRKKDEEIPFDI
jgi:single-strand DNA-binding protein